MWMPDHRKDSGILASGKYIIKLLLGKSNLASNSFMARLGHLRVSNFPNLSLATSGICKIGREHAQIIGIKSSKSCMEGKKIECRKF